jgi:hypothetical protein
MPQNPSNTTSGNGIYSIGGSTTGNGIYAGGTGTYITPAFPTGAGIGGINTNSTVWTTIYAPTHAYYLFKLPTKEMPELVFIDGLAVTVGAFGSAAQVSFAPNQTMILTKDSFNTIKLSTTVILQHKTEIYRYAITNTYAGPSTKEKTVFLDATLLSIVKR